MSALDALLGTISYNGAELELGSGLNFTGAGVTVSRNAVTGKIDISVSGGGGSRHAIQDEGSPVPDQPVLNFVGAGVSASASAGKIDVNIPGAPAVLPGGAPANVTRAAAAAGAAGTYARSDHKHDVATAAAVDVDLADATSAEGSSSNLARADHVHGLTGVLAGAHGGTGLSSANLGQLIHWNGSGFTAFGPTAVLYNTNAAATKALADGSRWLMDDANNTTSRIFTFTTTGATEGRCVSFLCKVTSAFPYTLDYGTGTMVISTSRVVSLRFSASFGWELAGWEG